MAVTFTAESVTAGQPDKLCDLIAEKILDETLKQDPQAYVGCEAAVSGNNVTIMGEITSAAKISYEDVARGAIAQAGYETPGLGFDAQTCGVTTQIREQSEDIARGILRKDPFSSGAGDQGEVFGYACCETADFMPLPITLAHRLARRLEKARREGEIAYLRPDGRAQITMEYTDSRPQRIAAIILSAQHTPWMKTEQLRAELAQKIISKTIGEEWIDDQTQIYINPTGRFVLGGPAAHVGLTGRKQRVDAYGGAVPQSGSLAGKDPSKIHRSAAYAARYLAKNFVAAGLAKRCEIRLAYAMGLADPISLNVECFHTETTKEERLKKFAEELMDLRPAAISERFGLRRPIYEKLSCYGHFGENAAEMPWEQIDLF